LKRQASSKLRSFFGAFRLRSLLVATKPCNTPSSGACPAPELAQGSIQVKGLIGETGQRCGTLRANTESDVQTARGLPGSQITDRLVQTCWANRGFPTSCAKKGRRPDGGRYKSSLADASLPRYPSMRSGKPIREADEVD
jgi:hypothetical protein